MPIIHNNILSVTIKDFEKCGMSEDYLWRALSAQRTGEVYCWQHHKEGKRVYIHYDTLKDCYKELIKAKLCGGIEPELWLRNQESARLNSELAALCSKLAVMVEVRAEDVKNLSETRLYSATEIQQIARAAGWLRVWRLLDATLARKLGFKSVKEIQAELFKNCLNEQSRGFVKFPKPINNERVLDRKAREYAATGLECLISGCFGNANREMISKAAHARLMELAAQPIKLSYEDVSMYFNQEAQETGAFQPMTVSAIKQHLNKLKHKRVWSYFRHGKLEADEIYQPEILRELPSFADALWSIDGTTMQIYYRDADGKMKSDLYVEFVTDVYSSAIIGYSVAFSETAGMVAEALKDAIDTHGYKPYQLQYDNSSANQQDAIQGIMNNMSRVHFGTKPYHGKSKYVETYIGHFQQRVLRKSEAFKGGNITAKSLNSKANADLLAKFKKHPELLLSESEVIAAFGEAVREWNARGQKRDKYGFFTGESKITRYETCANENRVKLNYLEKISLFMAELKKPYKYGKQGIRITLNGVKHNYIVPDTDNIGDFEFSRLYLGEEFTVRINPLAPDFITLWKNGVNVATAHEKEEYSSCIADLKKRGDGAKIKQFIAKQEEYGYQHAKKEMERQREILQSEGLRATGTDGFGWYDTDKTTFNIIQGIQEDVHNGIAETEEINPELRALLNM